MNWITIGRNYSANSWYVLSLHIWSKYQKPFRTFIRPPINSSQTRPVQQFTSSEMLEQQENIFLYIIEIVFMKICWNKRNCDSYKSRNATHGMFQLGKVFPGIFLIWYLMYQLCLLNINSNWCFKHY